MRDTHERDPGPDVGVPWATDLVRSWPSFFVRPRAIVSEYRREDVGPDVLAGLTVAMVALPQAIAYASIANLPAHFGLYSAIVASIVARSASGTLSPSSRNVFSVW